jgi:ComF family protein
VYEGVMREAVHLFKYRRRTALGRRLMDRLASSLPALPPSDGVLPVPLHPSRLREREFNPALLLARILAGREGVPLFPDLLIRTRPTPPQMALHRRERRKNVRHAFAVNANADVSGLRWLLVDDVLTTGATVNECARILKRNGAAEVTVVTLARVDAPSSSGGKTPEAELGRFKVDRSPDGLV